jgi:hypothetical protein
MSDLRIQKDETQIQQAQKLLDERNKLADQLIEALRENPELLSDPQLQQKARQIAALEKLFFSFGFTRPLPAEPEVDISRLNAFERIRYVFKKEHLHRHSGYAGPPYIHRGSVYSGNSAVSSSGEPYDSSVCCYANSARY